MREPTSVEAKFSWWADALATGDAAFIDGEPQVGYYRTRRWPRKQYWLPARIWLEPGEIDPDTGELMSDERLCAEVDGQRRDPFQIWTWLQPISLEDYQWLTASRPLQPSAPPKSKTSR